MRQIGVPLSSLAMVAASALAPTSVACGKGAIQVRKVGVVLVAKPLLIKPNATHNLGAEAFDGGHPDPDLLLVAGASGYGHRRKLLQAFPKARVVLVGGGAGWGWVGRSAIRRGGGGQRGLLQRSGHRGLRRHAWARGDWHWCGGRSVIVEVVVIDVEDNEVQDVVVGRESWMR